MTPPLGRWDMAEPPEPPVEVERCVCCDTDENVLMSGWCMRCTAGEHRACWYELDETEPPEGRL